jgi:hypothetical protein
MAGLTAARVDLAGDPERVFRALTSQKFIYGWWVRTGVFNTQECSATFAPGAMARFGHRPWPALPARRRIPGDRSAARARAHVARRRDAGPADDGNVPSRAALWRNPRHAPASQLRRHAALGLSRRQPHSVQRNEAKEHNRINYLVLNTFWLMTNTAQDFYSRCRRHLVVVRLGRGGWAPGDAANLNEASASQH